MTIEEMNEIRRKTGVTYEQICFDSGVPISTVAKVLSGATKNPRIRTMQALENVLAGYKEKYDRERGLPVGKPAEHEEKGEIKSYGGSACHGAKKDAGTSHTVYTDREEKPSGTSCGGSDVGAPFARGTGKVSEPANACSSFYAGASSVRQSSTGCLRETPYVYGSEASKSRHRYTTADRDALPEERRTELIDGVLYDMASPSLLHQDLILQIAWQFEDCMDQHPSDCHLFISPADVMLDEDIYTAVVPDLFIICEADQLTLRNVQGAPAFVLEVLSPSSRRIDFTIKLGKYKSSGVKEYWIVDPMKKSVTVFNLMLLRGETEDGSEIEKYTFEDSVPVIISDGSCSIDMKKAAAHLDRVFGDAWRTEN